MRGFRGSRAAQLQSVSRYGRPDSYHSYNPTGYPQSQHTQGANSHQAALPEWLKTPETKAREAAEAAQRRKPQLKLIKNSAPIPSSSQTAGKTQSKASLSVVGSKPVAKKKRVAAPKAAPKTAKRAAAPAKRKAA